MAEYIEITDPKEIRRLNTALAARLKGELPYSETRTIGYPQGKFDAPVRFLSDKGGDQLYWSAWRSDDKSAIGSFFGHGDPHSGNSLNIDVQFNFPVVRFSRRMGGAFLRHLTTHNVVLAHRGIVTLGHGRVSKAALFAEMVTTIREAQAGSEEREFLLIGEFNSPTLVQDIDIFSSELRRAAQSLKASDAIPKGRSGLNSTLNAAAKLSGRLKKYFDEFSGQRTAKNRNQIVADCYHGIVVRAIRDAFEGSPETLKSQAIDLTVIVKQRIYLFEVKTSASPQHIYTAIGQLLAHSPTVTEYARGKLLIKVMVIPEQPNRRLRRLLEESLDIRLIIFARSEDGIVTLPGLEQLTS